MEPNGGEAAEPNFPRSLHNGAELFLRVGLLGNAHRLQACTATLFETLQKGPDGRTTHRMGRACVCWGCGHVGLPRNAESCHKTRVTPAGVCQHCGQSDQTNFVRVTANKGKDTVPWLELKAVASDEALAKAERAEKQGTISSGGGGGEAAGGGAGGGNGGGGGAAPAVQVAMDGRPVAAAVAPKVKKGAKVRPNDPCPCGSGKKAKKCCYKAGG